MTNELIELGENEEFVPPEEAREFYAEVEDKIGTIAQNARVEIGKQFQRVVDERGVEEAREWAMATYRMSRATFYKYLQGERAWVAAREYQKNRKAQLSINIDKPEQLPAPEQPLQIAGPQQLPTEITDQIVAMTRAEVQAELENAKERIVNLEGTLNKVNADRRTAEATVKDLQRKLDDGDYQLQSELSAAENKLRAARERADGLEAALAKANQERRELSLSIKTSDEATTTRKAVAGITAKLSGVMMEFTGVVPATIDRSHLDTASWERLADLKRLAELVIKTIESLERPVIIDADLA